MFVLCACCELFLQTLYASLFMPTFHSLKVAEVRRETEDTVSIAFAIPDALKADYEFTQGQYVSLRNVLDGMDVRRSYSICSAVGSGELRVAIKKVDGGMFSTYANEVLKAGDELDVMTPMGKFFTPLDEKNDKSYVAFAAGSGITPMMSIIKTTLETEPASEFALFYNNRSFKTIIFRDELEDLKDTYLGRLRVFHILTREPNEVGLYTGRLDEEKATQLIDNLVGADMVDEAFICGPETMIFNVKDALTGLGVDESKVHFELFTSPLGKLGEKKERVVEKELEGKSAEVHVNVNGVSVDFKLPFGSNNILDAAMERGADLPFSCKGGVCCTCRAKLIEGEVDMEINYALEPEEVAAGFILTCQAFPKSDKVVVDFDEQ